MSMSAAGRWFALATLSVIALVLFACGESDPDRPPDRDSIISYKDHRELAEASLAGSDKLQDQCDDPRVAEMRAKLDELSSEELWRSLLTLPTESEQAIIEVVAKATAEQRGIPLSELPPVWLVDSDDRSSYTCLSEELSSKGDYFDPVYSGTARIEGTSIGVPAYHLTLLLGQAYGDVIEEVGHLAPLVFIGWYGELPELKSAPGEITVALLPPLEPFHIGIISHELVHFLQDKQLNWHLHERYAERTSTDGLTAWQWVVEGDGALHELCLDTPPLDTLLADVEWPSADDEDAPPEWFSLCWLRGVFGTDASRLSDPYTGGAALLRTLREERGAEAIDELLLNPPETTEQILHIDKLLSREAPIALSDLEALQRDVLPSSEWQEPILDRMGEQWLAALIVGATNDAEFATVAAAGWGGDQMALWQSHDSETEVVTWQVVFDDAEEHDEGVSGLRRWFFSHTDNEAEAVDEYTLSWDGPTGAARLVSLEEAVWLVASNETVAADAVASGIRDGEWRRYWSE